MKDRILSPFEQWMVWSNLERAAIKGEVKSTVDLLRSRGYTRVAAGVEDEWSKRHAA